MRWRSSPAGNAAALTVSGRLADSLGRKPMMVAGLLVTGVATAAIGFTHELGWFLLASALAGIGSGLLGPAQQAAVADVIGSGRSGGKVLAVYQMTSDIGAIAGPVLAGVLADRLGYGWAFGVTGRRPGRWRRPAGPSRVNRLNASRVRSRRCSLG